MGLLRTPPKTSDDEPQDEKPVADEVKDLLRNLAVVVVDANASLDVEVPVSCPSEILFHLRSASNHLWYVQQKLKDMGYVP